MNVHNSTKFEESKINSIRKRQKKKLNING